MRLNRILVCMKRTLVERNRRHKGFREVLEREGRDSPAFERIFASHAHTLGARRNTLKILDSLGIDYTVMTRPAPVDESGFDLALVVGGDGTMLNYARYLRDLPLLGVNSSPASSVGRFHYTDVAGLSQVITEISTGELSPKYLVRIRVTIDGVTVPFPVLNEVLFAHKNPAATSRYIIRVNGREEAQRSSGVWVSTAAGSSGAVLSAGGELQDPEGTQLQYRVREPFLSPLDHEKMTLIGGVLSTGKVEFVSRMFHAAVFMDGTRGVYEVNYWSKVTVDTGSPGLRVFLRK